MDRVGCWLTAVAAAAILISSAFLALLTLRVSTSRLSSLISSLRLGSFGCPSKTTAKKKRTARMTNQVQSHFRVLLSSLLSFVLLNCKAAFRSSSHPERLGYNTYKKILVFDFGFVNFNHS